MARNPIPEDRIIDASLSLAAEKGWARVSLADIAETTGLSLADIRSRFPSREAILRGFVRRIDAEVLDRKDPDADSESVHDRLFDVLMRRFDALQAHREGVLAVTDGLARDPVATAVLLPEALRSMAWMLEAAGLDSHGLKGRLRAKGLAAIWVKTARVWMTDDTEDMAKTMAALDKTLRQAEHLASFLPWEYTRSRRASAGPPEGETAPA